MKIRRLTLDDLGFAQRIRAIAGWNQTDADWQRLINYEPEGCFVIECDGQPAGTATTTSYQDELAWIGMVLVDPDFRRRGLATALMEHCLAYLLQDRKVSGVRLDATPDGQKVYEKLGFTAEYELARWEGQSLGESVEIDSVYHVDLKSISELDKMAFGADRILYLDGLQRSSRVQIRGNGYGMIRPGMVANYLGPVVAGPQSTGQELIRVLLSRPPGAGPVFWDIPEQNPEARRFAETLGFQKQRRLIRMWTGAGQVVDRPELQWAIGSPETG